MQHWHFCIAQTLLFYVKITKLLTTFHGIFIMFHFFRRYEIHITFLLLIQCYYHSHYHKSKINHACYLEIKLWNSLIQYFFYSNLFFPYYPIYTVVIYKFIILIIPIPFPKKFHRYSHHIEGYELQQAIIERLPRGGSRSVKRLKPDDLEKPDCPENSCSISWLCCPDICTKKKHFSFGCYVGCSKSEEYQFYWKLA